jgi:hypothetical protein
MKTIKSKVVRVKLNTEVYSDAFFESIRPYIPKVGDTYVSTHADYYPFEKGGADGYGSYPTEPQKDKNGELSSKWTYYVYLEQIELL